MRILIVEDEKIFCNKIARNLRKEGYEVDVCYDGSSALEHMSCESCDLILLDLNLPDIDGIEVLRQLRSYDNETGVLDNVCKKPDSRQGRGTGCGCQRLSC